MRRENMKEIMELSGKKVLVIGMGKTGLATARFLLGQGADLVITDEKPREKLEELCRRELKESAWEIRSYDLSSLAGVGLVVPSPGVPPRQPLLVEALRRNLPIVSELELAYRFLSCPVIAITGTNGKTTTTTLIGAILKRAGKKIFLGGNIGEPLIGFVSDSKEADYAVVEVSSFQLQWTERFCPAVAVLLNTTCDHVDYHGSFAAYAQAKERIFANQRAEHLAILNADEEATAPLARRLAARVACFSSSGRVPEGMFVAESALVRVTAAGERETYPLAMLKLPGRHNQENVMAAILAARECGVSPGDIAAAIADFRGLSHRIEFAGEKRGIAFYDDSKGTNVGAVVRALESFSQPLFLLMGGRDKDGDFETLGPLIKGKVKKLVLFGEARDRIAERLGGLVATAVVATLREATELAGSQAAAGDIVLLSPGCASFDEFTDYKARGDFFKKLVGGL